MSPVPTRPPTRPPTRHADRTGTGTVSSTSAQRFAERVRARRRRRVGIALGVATLVTLAGWTAFASPWFSVRTVTVTGTARLDPAAVREAAADEVGRPMLLLRARDLRARVAAQPLVVGVSVTRRWPSTVVVAVRERQAVAAVPDGDRVRLVDPEGVVVGTAASPPAGLPMLRVNVEVAGPETVKACLTVLRDLPATTRVRVRQIGADTPDAVWLRLRDGSRVEWGGAERTPFKADVLAALLPQKARVYDVGSPDAPTVRGHV